MPQNPFRKSIERHGVPFSPNLIRNGLLIASALAVGSALGDFVAGSGKPNNKPQQPEISNSQAFKQFTEYDVTKLKPVGQRGFAELVTLKSSSVMRDKSLKQRLELGNEIQGNVGWFTLSLLGTGRNFGNHVDEMDLAKQLIPSSTQTALRDRHINFVPVKPVGCNLMGVDDPYPNPYGYYLNPYDYSINPPSAFNVRAEKIDGIEEVVVPLGVAQQPNPYFGSDIATPNTMTNIYELNVEAGLSPISNPFELTSVDTAPPCSDFAQEGSMINNGQLHLFELY